MWTRRRAVTVSDPALDDRESREHSGSMTTLTEAREHPARHRIEMAARLADDMRQTGGRHRHDDA